MSSAADFGGDYAPGGLTTAAKRRRIARINGRKGGLASGRRRRQLAKGSRPARRSRDQALALHYAHRQLTRERFETLYATRFPRPERGTAAVAWERGRETLWTHYESVWRLYRACGQHARTTNEQRGQALCVRGRPRCRRTVQRLNRRLEALGVAYVAHLRNQRATPGRKDCLVLEMRTPRILHVTPPLRGTINPPFGREVDGGAPKGLGNQKGETALIPAAPPPVPPDGGDQHRQTTLHVTPADSPPPATAEGTGRKDIAAQIAFLELKAAVGWAPRDLEARLAALRGRLGMLERDAHA